MAATDLERLVVQLSADIKRYENAMRRAQGVTNRQLGNIQRQATKAGDSISASFGRVGAAIAAGLAAGASVQALGRLSDAATRIDNTLKIAGVSGAELEKVYQGLAKAASDNGAPIETLAQLYGKASQAQKDLGVSSGELIKFTENVALGLRVSGTTAQAASGALLQLGQALSTGRVFAEEFNSIVEGTPAIARAMAIGLEEAGGSVGKLKQLIVDGQVSSEALFRAFEAGSVVLEQQASKATFTFAQAITNLQNSLVDAAREFNSATGAGENFANGIDGVARAINSIEFDTFIQKIGEAQGALKNFFNTAGDAEIFQRLNELLGVTNAEGVPINIDKTEAESKIAELENEVETLQTLIELNTNLGIDVSGAIENLAAVRGELAALRAEASGLSETMGPTRVVPGSGLIQTPDTGGGTNGSMGGSTSRGGARRVPTVDQVSIKDFAAPAASGGGGGGAKKGRSGGQSDYAKEIEQIRERTAALVAETQAQSQINPLLDDYGFASERARSAQELLTAAQKSGLAAGKELKDVSQLLSGNFEGLSPAAREQATAMLELASGYASASAGADKLAESQARAREAADDFKQTSKSVLSGFISDMRNGVSAADALTNALNKVVDKLIDVALNAAFDGIGGGGGFGSLLKGLGIGGGGFAITPGAGLFSEGGYTGAGGKYQPAGVVHKGEYVFDQASVQAAGGPAALDAMRQSLKGYASGGYVGSAPRLPNMSRARQDQQNIGVTVRVDNDGNLKAFVQRESAQVSSSVVQATAPSIIEQSTQSAGSALGKGKFDSSMSKYGVRRQANVG